MTTLAHYPCCFRCSNGPCVPRTPRTPLGSAGRLSRVVAVTVAARGTFAQRGARITPANDLSEALPACLAVLLPAGWLALDDR